MGEREESPILHSLGSMLVCFLKFMIAYSWVASWLDLQSLILLEFNSAKSPNWKPCHIFPLCGTCSCFICLVQKWCFHTKGTANVKLQRYFWRMLIQSHQQQNWRLGIWHPCYQLLSYTDLHLYACIALCIIALCIWEPTDWCIWCHTINRICTYN